MATVPIYDQPQVNPNVGQMQPMQAQTVEPIRDFTGKQIEEAGQARVAYASNLMRVAEKQKEFEEQLLLDKSEIDLRTFIVDFTKENEGSVGEKATGLTEKFSTSYYKKVSEFVTQFSANGAADSRLVKRFQTKANEIGLASIAKFSTFEAAQKQEVRVNNNKALGKILSNTASSVPFSLKDGKVFDGPEFETSKKQLIENLKKRAELLGYGEDSDVYKQLVQEEMSSVYMDRVANIINTNPLAAPAYFDQVKDFITNDEFKNKFKGMATKVAQEAEAEKWVESKFTDALASKDKKSIANLRLDIMKQFSGDQQKVALQIYEQLEQSMITQNEQIRKTYSSQAWDQVLQTKTSWGKVDNTTKEWLRDNDPDTYRSINIFIDNNIQNEKNAIKAERAEERSQRSEERAIRSEERSVRSEERAEKRAEAQEQREKDRVERERRREIREAAKARQDEKEDMAFGELSSIMGNDQKTFINMDLNKWRTRLSESDWKWFSKQQIELKNKPETQKQATTLSSRISTEADILGIGKSVVKKARFEKIIYNEIDSFITNNNGKQPDAKQINSIIKDATKEYTTGEFLGIRSKSRRYELNRAKTVNDIPKDLLNDLKADLKRQNLSVSDQEMVNIYNVYIGQND
jgi:hypothetical protein